MSVNYENMTIDTFGDTEECKLIIKGVRPPSLKTHPRLIQAQVCEVLAYAIL